MPSPFPGMDPYLEDPEHWHSFHCAYIAELGRRLNGVLGRKYLARIEKRVYIADDDEDLCVPDVHIRLPLQRTTAAKALPKPSVFTEPEVVTISTDFEIEEWALKIVRPKSHDLIGVIELTSPSNKVSGRGRQSYLDKRRETLTSDANWMEIDLLRGGPPVIRSSRYDRRNLAVFSSPAIMRPRSELWQFRLEDRLPTVRVPLVGRSEYVVLDLQDALDSVYDESHYDLELDYSGEPKPPFRKDQLKWAASLLRAYR